MKPQIISYRVEYTKNLKWKHEYKCPYCSSNFVSIGADVNSGRIVSCGCYNASQAKKRFTKHGLNKSPEHRAWVEMRRRCLDSTRVGWKNYGGRGTTICERWLSSFENFLADVGPSPLRSLDRIDNNGNYEPGNCRWATRSQQNSNQRRSKRYNSHIQEE